VFIVGHLYLVETALPYLNADFELMVCSSWNLYHRQLILLAIALNTYNNELCRREAEKLELVRHEQSDMARYAKEVCEVKHADHTTELYYH
jgi:hypothetical protein